MGREEDIAIIMSDLVEAVNLATTKGVLKGQIAAFEEQLALKKAVLRTVKTLEADVELVNGLEEQITADKNEKRRLVKELQDMEEDD